MKIEIKENEIYVDDVKFVKAELTENLASDDKKIGDVINFGGFDWYIIDQDEESYTLFLKDQLGKKIIKKHFTQKEMIDDDGDVKYSFTDNSWEHSYIRLVLNTSFIYELDRDKLVKMNDDFVRLIEKDECWELSYDIRKTESGYGYWTMTPYNYATDAGVLSFNRFNGSAYDNYSFRVVGRGVRPVIKIKNDFENVECVEDE